MMNKINQVLVIVALILITSALPAQTPTASPRTPAQNLHPFYLKMNFIGGTFHDPKNTDCGTGFIGWVQHDDDAPELIYVEDVFRRVKLNCTKTDLQKGGISCLGDREITFSHTNNGKTYKAHLRLTNKDTKRPTLQLQRFVDGERILLCNFRKVL